MSATLVTRRSSTKRYAQFGKRDGSYAALRDELRYETSPIENFRFEFGPVLSFYDITGVTGT